LIIDRENNLDDDSQTSPISVDWLMQDTNQFVVTYDNAKTLIYDTETSKIIRQIVNDNSTSIDRINRVISHPTQAIIITAHDDRTIRYFDTHTGRIIVECLS
jgi:striatin 1/3/4